MGSWWSSYAWARRCALFGCLYTCLRVFLIWFNCRLRVARCGLLLWSFVFVSMMSQRASTSVRRIFVSDVDSFDFSLVCATVLGSKRRFRVDVCGVVECWKRKDHSRQIYARLTRQPSLHSRSALVWRGRFFEFLRMVPSVRKIIVTSRSTSSLSDICALPRFSFQERYVCRVGRWSSSRLFCPVGGERRGEK